MPPSLVSPRHLLPCHLCQRKYKGIASTISPEFPWHITGRYREFSSIFFQYKYHESTRTSLPGTSHVYLRGKYQCIVSNLSLEFSWHIPERYRELFPDILLVISTRGMRGTCNLVFPWYVFQQNTMVSLSIFSWSFSWC